MPIYEYTCSECSEEFEELVSGNSEVKCPSCGSPDVKKKFSLFGMSGVEKPVTSAGSGCGSCSKSTCTSCK
jgi:putative FmdB family regulatory protein